MAITKDSGRQYPLVARMPFAYTDLVSGTYAGMVDLPVNAIVTDARVVISTLFNSATTDVFSIGDQPTGAAARATEYSAASADVTAVPTEIVGKTTNYTYTGGGTVRVVWTGTGAAPSAGAGVLVVEYIIDGRTQENQ